MKKNKIVPIIYELKTELTPIELASLLRHHPQMFYLDSNMLHPQYGRYSYIGHSPFLLFQSRGYKIRLYERGKQKPSYLTGNPLKILNKIIQKYSIESLPDLPPFCGGLVGYIAYDFSQQLEFISINKKADFDIPDIEFGFYDVIFALDHFKQKIWIISTGFPETKQILRKKIARQRLKETLIELEPNKINLPDKIKSNPNFYILHSAPVESNMTRYYYQKMILQAQEYIAAGDIYQVNLSQRFKTKWADSPWDLYLRLRHCNPSSYSLFLNYNNYFILSSSPELFLRISQNHIETRPIKGTRPRGINSFEDNRYRMELLESAKDRAELLMIVDLERNDLGKICKFGSVEVSSFPEIESYASVWHTLATVGGYLKDNIQILDIIQSCFPGGSITGAPKIRSMQIIDELEPSRRGIYTGSIGYIGFNEEIEFNIAIRTLFLQNDNLYFHTGGGITADSDPDMEYKETLDKSRAIFQAINELSEPELFQIPK